MPAFIQFTRMNGHECLISVIDIGYVEDLGTHTLVRAGRGNDHWFDYEVKDSYQDVLEMIDKAVYRSRIRYNVAARET